MSNEREHDPQQDEQAQGSWSPESVADDKTARENISADQRDRQNLAPEAKQSPESMGAADSSDDGAADSSDDGAAEQGLRPDADPERGYRAAPEPGSQDSDEEAPPQTAVESAQDLDEDGAGEPPD